MPLLEFGSGPEYRPVTADGVPRIFVARDGADWWRIRYQLAHEVFHWLCTPPDVFHWVHEALAVEVAVRAMEEIGETDYADRERARLAAQAAELSLDEMLAVELGRAAYPVGLYGRAWLTIDELIGVAGWDAVKLLADSFDAEGRPDIVGWGHSLAPETRAAIVRSPAGRVVDEAAGV